MNYGSLFTGIGGLDLGFDWAGWKPAWQVENDPACIKVLEAHWPNTERHMDIHDTNFTHLARVDCIIGGFPCQPVSHAGQRQGTSDARWLWPEMLRAIREQRPAFVVAENVYGLVTHDSGLLLEAVYADLEAEQYEVAPPIVFPAAAVGAYHRRDRVWICAHARSGTGRTQPALEQEERAEDYSAIRQVAPYASIPRLPQTLSARLAPERTWQPPSNGRTQWAPEPNVDRVVDGLLPKLDRDRLNARLMQLGNAVVPQAAYQVAIALAASATGL